jgi:hypothetical protein
MKFLNLENSFLLSINYDIDLNIIIYCFNQGGEIKSFIFNGRIPVIEISKISIKLNIPILPSEYFELLEEITTLYLRGKKIIFPIKITSLIESKLSEKDYEHIILQCEGRSLETLLKYSRPNPMDSNNLSDFNFENRKEIFF